MKIYLVKRTDEINWDEYDSWVVVAHNPREAKKMCGYLTVTVREIKLGKTNKIILGSFNAG